MVKLLHDNVLVLPFEADDVTKGGIIIPSTAKEKPTKGKVISVGNGVKDVPMELKENDVILYGKYSGTEVTIEGIDYVLLRQTDVFCILK